MIFFIFAPEKVNKIGTVLPNFIRNLGVQYPNTPYFKIALCDLPHGYITSRRRCEDLGDGAEEFTDTFCSMI